jgi:hypothetical protein
MNILDIKVGEHFWARIGSKICVVRRDEDEDPDAFYDPQRIFRVIGSSRALWIKDIDEVIEIIPLPAMDK